MSERKLTLAQWETWLTRFKAVDRQLRHGPWFTAGWDTYLSGRFEGDSPRIIFLLFRKHWVPGLIQGVPYPALIYFKTRLTHSDLAAGTIKVGLHVETNEKEHGINRARFLEALAAGGAVKMTDFPSYDWKPRNLNRPFNARVAFAEETLVNVLAAELVRLHNLGDAIDQAIEKCRKL